MALLSLLLFIFLPVLLRATEASSAVYAHGDWVVAEAVKSAVAGGVAGAVGTAALYPLDAAKTVRQAAPEQFASVRTALQHLLRTHHVYKGVYPAVLGAIPSSALYFGSYETAKALLRKFTTLEETDTVLSRGLLHAGSAASGNLMSSAIFVPKELIKQQMQYHHTGSARSVVREILQQRGVRGLYTGYRATVLRNVPTAALRFGLYEEFKRSFASSGHSRALDWRNFAAGAASGALASFAMTPVDVIKTRVSTGTCSIHLPACVQQVVAESGWRTLWAGAGSRMMASAAFSAIGFGTFEATKWMLSSRNRRTGKRGLVSQEDLRKIKPCSIRHSEKDSATYWGDKTTRRSTSASFQMSGQLAFNGESSRQYF